MNKKKKNIRQVILWILVYVIIITVVVIGVERFLFSPMQVVGDSMNPTLSDHDLILVNKSAYQKENPERFDLVVFTYQYDHDMKYIKRVIGLPGETIEIKNNTIYIDSEELKEYYGIYEHKKKQLEDYGPYTLAKDEFFVLGDNRQHSVDSRSGDVGPVKAELLVGKATFRFWPLNAFGSLKYQ